MAVTKDDYPKLAVKAAESVLLELVHILGEYLDSIVVIGGMVPRYLIKEPEEPHIGTTDVDLALDHRRFDEPGYETLHKLLTSHHYLVDRDQPFIYRRPIVMDGKNITVQVEICFQVNTAVQVKNVERKRYRTCVHVKHEALTLLLINPSTSR